MSGDRYSLSARPEGEGKLESFEERREVEEVRSGDVDEDYDSDDHQSRVFNSFRRLFIMESAESSFLVSASADEGSSTAEVPLMRSAESDLANAAGVSSLTSLLSEPMDHSSPSLPSKEMGNDNAKEVLIPLISSPTDHSSSASSAGETRKSPKRSLASILDEDPPVIEAGSPKPSSLPHPADANNNDRIDKETIAASPRRFPTSSTSAFASIASATADLPARESPKRPSEEQPEEGKVSPKRLSLQFRPDRISSTSTPFAPLKIPAKGVRALSFDGNQGPPTTPVPQPPARKTRLSTLSLGTDCSLESIAENPNNDVEDGIVREEKRATVGIEDPFPSPSDQSSILAHGFPSSSFYSPCASARSTSNAASADSGAKPKDRASMPGIASSSPSTQRFREALTVEISRRLSLEQSSSVANSFLPFSSSPSKHPMLTRSSSSSSSLKDPPPEMDSSKWPGMNKASLYSLYEALSQESGYWTRSRCRDVTIESQLASGSQQSLDVIPSLTASSTSHHAHHVNAPFCCVPDTPSHLCLRRPLAKCKREAEKLKEEEKARRKKEVNDKINDYLGNLTSVSPSLWIGRHIGLEKLDVISELNQVEPRLVQKIMTTLDDSSLKAFSLVSKTWGSVVHEHKPSRIRLQTHDDLVLAYRIQTRENTPMDSKTRAFNWSLHSGGGANGNIRNASLGHFSASSDLNRSYLGSDVSFIDSPFVPSAAFTPDPQRVAFKPVLRQASVNTSRHDESNSSISKQTRLSLSPRARASTRATRSPRASASSYQSPSRSGLQSPSRRVNNGFQSPSRRAPSSGAIDPSRSPRSPFGRVLSPCRTGAQNAARFGQRRLFTSPTKRDTTEGSKPPLPFPPQPDAGSNPNSIANQNQASGRPKLLISALSNNTRSSPLPSSLESSSRRLFDSPTRNNSSSGYDLRSQGTTSSTDAKKHQTDNPLEHGTVDAAVASTSTGSGGGKTPKGDETKSEDRATSSGHQEKTPLCASNYQPSPSSGLSSRRSLSKSHNKSLNKSKQKLRRL